MSCNTIARVVKFMSVGNKNRVGRRVPPEMAPQYLVLAICKNRQKIRQPKTCTQKPRLMLDIDNNDCIPTCFMSASDGLLLRCCFLWESHCLAEVQYGLPPYIVALQMRNRDVFITISSRLLSALCGIRSSGLGIID